MHDNESAIRNDVPDKDDLPGIEDAIRHLEKYLDDECYTEFHQNVCRLAIEALRDRQAKEADSAPGQTRKPTRNPMLLKLDITFATDGDFHFDDAEALLDDRNPLYRNAVVTYDHRKDDEWFEFHLEAHGDADACQYAARDLLETLTCSLRTSRYYVIQDIYRLLITAKDQCLWNDGGDIDYSDTISGNYEGTGIRLRITRMP